ncbi:hypothetical protein HPB48_005142 [Haemaphysalis longicornis]|uniref:Uncharacterized protein n=1 Tax=Haemaphysalis longicornis TaxID=44386 RepID=A0A9J6FH66_HAELO|nr:hypothetical protein HPB48_005142 [Haemaphysalis longicornis]
MNCQFNTPSTTTGIERAKQRPDQFAPSRSIVGVIFSVLTCGGFFLEPGKWDITSPRSRASSPGDTRADRGKSLLTGIDAPAAGRFPPPPPPFGTRQAQLAEGIAVEGILIITLTSCYVAACLQFAEPRNSASPAHRYSPPGRTSDSKDCPSLLVSLDTFASCTLQSSILFGPGFTISAKGPCHTMSSRRNSTPSPKRGYSRPPVRRVLPTQRGLAGIASAVSRPAVRPGLQGAFAELPAVLSNGRIGGGFPRGKVQVVGGSANGRHDHLPEDHLLRQMLVPPAQRRQQPRRHGRRPGLRPRIGTMAGISHYFQLGSDCWRDAFKNFSVSDLHFDNTVHNNSGIEKSHVGIFQQKPSSRIHLREATFPAVRQRHIWSARFDDVLYAAIPCASPAADASLIAMFLLRSRTPCSQWAGQGPADTLAGRHWSGEGEGGPTERANFPAPTPQIDEEAPNEGGSLLSSLAHSRNEEGSEPFLLPFLPNDELVKSWTQFSH